MPSTYSSRARFTLQATGENFNTWGVILNQQDIQLIDDNINGVVAFALSGPKTLTTANGAADEARMSAINVTGGTGGTITIPAVSTHYWVRNGAVGNVIISTGGATTATVYPGETVAVMTDGAAVYRVRPTSFDGAPLTNVGTPTSPTDATNKGYVDTAVAGVVAGGLPPQTGNAGKFIGTDGVNGGWLDTSALTWTLGGLRIGGATAAFPMLKRAATALQHRLADDSGDAPTTAATAAQFDNSTTLATTAWIKRFGTQFSAVTPVVGSGTLTAAAIGSLVSINASTTTTTLPQASAFPPGATIRFYSAGGSNGVSPFAGDVLTLNGTNVGTVFLGLGDTMQATVNAAANGWVVNGGSASMAGSAAFTGASFTTPPQFASDTKLATTAFVQRALGNKQNNSVLVGTTTLTAAQAGQAIILSGGTGFTVTMPLASACPAGAMFRIMNSTSVAWTIARQGADLFVLGTTSPTSFILEGGGWVDLVASPSNNGWYTFGSSSLGASGFFSGSKAQTGYQLLPGGLYIQWGVTLGGAANTQAISNFPIAFPTSVFSFVCSAWSASATTVQAWGYGVSRTQYSVACSAASNNVAWFATGI